MSQYSEIRSLLTFRSASYWADRIRSLISPRRRPQSFGTDSLIAPPMLPWRFTWFRHDTESGRKATPTLSTRTGVASDRTLGGKWIPAFAGMTVGAARGNGVQSDLV